MMSVKNGLYFLHVHAVTVSGQLQCVSRGIGSVKGESQFAGWDCVALGILQQMLLVAAAFFF